MDIAPLSNSPFYLHVFRKAFPEERYEAKTTEKDFKKELLLREFLNIKVRWDDRKYTLEELLNQLNVKKRRFNKKENRNLRRN